MNTPLLKAALVGCGRIGAHTSDQLRSTLPHAWFPYSHADAVQAVPAASLVAVCDINSEAARSTASKFSVPAWYDDPARMLSEVRPDILLIATRTTGRSDLITLAASSGVRGIHFEKPLAFSLAGCRQALQAAESAGVHLSYGTVRRCMDVFVHAKRCLVDGRLGPLRHISAETRKGDLLWSHPHSFDLITFFSGVIPVTSIQASMEVPAGAFTGLTLDADPTVNGILLSFGSAQTASITAGGNASIRLAFDDGEITIGGNAAWLTETQRSVHARGGFTPPQIISVPVTGSGTQHALTRLCSAIHGEAPAPITAAEILRSNALGLASAWSALHGGKSVTLDEVPEDFTVTGRKGDLYA